MRKTLVTVALLALILTGGGCASSGVNKGDFNLVSLEDEWRLGDQLAGDIAKQMRIVDDSAAQSYLDQMGRRLVQQTEMAQMPWHFHIVADPNVNAFSIPGGHVYVNSGLLGAADTASEFAGVLSHEISHNIARHATEQISKAYGLEVLASLVIGQNPAVYQQVLAQIIGGGALARFSRQAEEEADSLGLRYMYGAGYDPRGMVTMFEELLRREKSSPGGVAKFFATHPLTQDRIRNVSGQISKLAPKSNLVQDDPAYQTIRRRLSS